MASNNNSNQSPLLRHFKSPGGSLSSGRSSRLERHSLEVSATVLRDILIGNNGAQNRPTQNEEDFAEIDEFHAQERVNPFVPTLKPFYGCCQTPPTPQYLQNQTGPFRSPPPARMSTFGQNNNGSMHFSNLDLRLVGRPHSHSPAPKNFPRQFGPGVGPASRLVSSAQNSPIRRYSPPEGSTGSGKSPRTSLDSSGSGPSPESPVSTSSPLHIRRGLPTKKPCVPPDSKRAPYYVADTLNNISGSSSTHSWFNMPGHSSGDPSACSDDVKFEIPYVCPKSCQSRSFESHDDQMFDDSMYRIIPGPDLPPPHFVKMMPDFSLGRPLFQRRIEREGIGPYYSHQGRDSIPYSNCVSCAHYFPSPQMLSYENLFPNQAQAQAAFYRENVNNNNGILISNPNNNNSLQDQCTSPTQRFVPHLHQDSRALYPCCCCVTSSQADMGASCREKKSQSGYESGGERTHCCSAHLISAQHQQKCEGYICENSSFVCEGPVPQPCQDSNRGRLVRVATAQGNCVDNFVEHIEYENDEVEQFQMRLVKKGGVQEAGSEAEENRPFEVRYRWPGGSGVPGLDASIHQIKKDDERETARWSAQSLHSLTSMKIDLPRVQNGGSSTSNGNTAAKISTNDKILQAPNLPRVTSGRKSLSMTKSYGGVTITPPSDQNLFFGSPQVDPLLLDSSRRRRAVNDERRRKTVAHFGPRSLPVGLQDGNEIPRAPIATPADRGVSSPVVPPIPEKKFSSPPQFSPLPNLPTDRNDGSRSCEDHQGHHLGPRNHPHRHSIGFLHSAALSRRRDECDSANVSFNVDSSLEHSFVDSSLGEHYQSPKDRDGDYSYAYDCSVSPAFLIKWNGEMDQSYEEDENPKAENIYEEIDKRVEDANAEQQEDSGEFLEKGMSDGNSSRKSSSLNSDSGIGASSGGRPHRQSRRVVGKLGTLDVAQRGGYKKKDGSLSNGKIPHPNSYALQQSSLDELLSMTTPGMSHNERLNLRKSLVDELFEELIQRHHNRVLEQLRLDVEEFIAPTPSPVPNKCEDEEQNFPQGATQSSQNGSPFQRTKSVTSKLFLLRKDKSANAKMSNENRRSTSSPRRLRKCESMDFKEILTSSGSASPSSNASKGRTQNIEKDDEGKSRRKATSQIFTSARKYSEAFHRKYFSRTSAAKIKQQQQQQLQQQQNQQSQVSRKGRRPLSAFLTGTSLSEVIGSGDDMSDSEEDSARRLQRSKIIQSFLQEQDNLETQTVNNNNNSSSTPKKKM